MVYMNLDGKGSSGQYRYILVYFFFFFQQVNPKLFLFFVRVDK